MSDGDEQQADFAESSAPMDHARAIVLHEDKRYYGSAESVYGAETETLLQDEDTQLLTEPIIKPKATNKTFAEDTSHVVAKPEDDLWMQELGALPDRIRNVCFLGQLHAGKTALLDVLLHQPHGTRYTDVRLDEQKRGLSVSSSQASFVEGGSHHISYLVNAIDCPGHSVFADECELGLRLSDGVIVVVDAVEGLLGTGVDQIRLAMKHISANFQISAKCFGIGLVINKIDRLILDLRMPPADAYYKLRHTIDSGIQYRTISLLKTLI